MQSQSKSQRAQARLMAEHFPDQYQGGKPLFRSRVAAAIVEKHLAEARQNIDRELAEWGLDDITQKPWVAANIKFAELGEEMLGLRQEPLATPNETLVAAPMPEARVRKDAERILGKTIIETDLQPHIDQRGVVAYRPMLKLSDFSKISFEAHGHSARLLVKRFRYNILDMIWGE